LAYNAVKSDESQPTFRRTHRLRFQRATNSRRSKTSADFDRTIRLYIPEHRTLHSHCRYLSGLTEDGGDFPQKRRFTLDGLHGVMSQKIVLFSCTGIEVSQWRHSTFALIQIVYNKGVMSYGRIRRRIRIESGFMSLNRRRNPAKCFAVRRGSPKATDWLLLLLSCSQPLLIASTNFIREIHLLILHSIYRKNSFNNISIIRIYSVLRGDPASKESYRLCIG
jgi:hypothetical protein